MSEFWLCAMHHGMTVTFFATPVASMSPAHQSLAQEDLGVINCSAPSDDQIRRLIECMPQRPMGQPLIYAVTDKALDVLHWLAAGRRVLACMRPQQIEGLFGSPSTAPIAVPKDDYAERLRRMRVVGLSYWWQAFDSQREAHGSVLSVERDDVAPLYRTPTDEDLATLDGLPLGIWRRVGGEPPTLLAVWNAYEKEWTHP